MLEVSRLCKSFGGNAVVKSVSLKLVEGERRVILGPNGAGKTTLFNLIVGELKPDSGTLRLGGQALDDLSVSQRARAGLARSYQKNNLFEEFTVLENLMLATAVRLGVCKSLWQDSFRHPIVRETAVETARSVALEDLLDQPVHSASYGIRRQLEVGLALALEPKILLMDEPTSGVGPSMIDAFHRLMASLPKKLTVLIVEHDMDLAFDIANCITVMNDGEIVFEGSPKETRESPLVREIYLGEE